MRSGSNELPLPQIGHFGLADYPPGSASVAACSMIMKSCGSSREPVVGTAMATPMRHLRAPSSFASQACAMRFPWDTARMTRHGFFHFTLAPSAQGDNTHTFPKIIPNHTDSIILPLTAADTLTDDHGKRQGCAYAGAAWITLCPQLHCP